ncbi:histidine phosphatase family protein [Bradyrhizobium ontarionense]|uniref:Histidine phosphatase family protein n=1 Tax=Bradyrhizobium ontarionense TaxID=2898149 RepID=A0ABY3RME9_9BRAD|nr:histidine phosphatase family protein [Bradyrhizobium sp. A19]UFZ07973.1 histidine phosphatase family protein [Bradyrhizobium sp. A19]
MPNARRFPLSPVLGSLVCALLTFLPAMASSEPLPADLIDHLRSGGYVIVFRHGATVSVQAKADSMSRPNAPAQRQLNEEGRAQAKSIGESMRKLRIPVALVLTSPVQRAVDTGKLLGFGEVSASPDLAESGPESAPDDNNRRAQALRRLATERPPAGSNVVIVSHKPNIVDAFGPDWSDVREGEASVFESDGNGGYKLVVRIQANAWIELAREAN